MKIDRTEGEDADEEAAGKRQKAKKKRRHKMQRWNDLAAKDHSVQAWSLSASTGTVDAIVCRHVLSARQCYPGRRETLHPLLAFCFTLMARVIGFNGSASKLC